MNAEQLQRLESAAVAAVGKSTEKCHVAMADIYKAAGLMPDAIAIPDGSRDWARAQGRGLIEPWVDGSGLFDSIAAVEPGALIGFRLGHCLHHVGIALPGGRMVHVFFPHGVRIAPAIPDPWKQRIAKIWRIKT